VHLRGPEETANIKGLGCPANVEARARVLPLICAAAQGLYAFRPADSIPAIQKYRGGGGLRAAEERKYRVLLFVSRAFVARMAQNFEWFEQPRLQHATLPGGILYNGLE